jgi:hypothetical protein|tara:strand:- start:504 stop:704 length:201 start_codon:yes stop_codon:yes gene_type:complete
MKYRGHNSRARRQQRKDQAIDRQGLRDKRTHKQQLELIKTRPGESKKEKHRLVVIIEKAFEESKNG